MRISLSLAAASATALVASLSGCTTRSATFDGYSDDQVWSAMVAAAESPDYDDWKIRQNEVFVDASARRLEVYRLLKRLYVTPYSDPRKEDREWRIQVMLTPTEEGESPTVDFTARQVTVPAHVWQEAERYFAQVRSLLGPPAPPARIEPSSADDSQPMPPPLRTEAGVTDASPSPAGTQPTRQADNAAEKTPVEPGPLEPLPE